MKGQCAANEREREDRVEREHVSVCLVLNIVELSDKYSFQNIDANEERERESTRGLFLC